MSLPFSSEQFFSIFEAYNRAIFPAQIFAYLLGGITVLLMFSQSVVRHRIISAVLAVFWVWTGIFYHLIYFSRINKAAYIFGVFFILQGLLFGWFGLIKKQVVFGGHLNLKSWVGLSLICYAMVIYALLGTLFGHNYPQSPMFGVTPCPLTIFTLGLLLASSTRVPWQLYLIPISWSFIGSMAAFLFGVKEDLGLLVAGGLGVIGLLSQNRKQAAYL